MTVYPVLADDQSADEPYSLTAEGEIVYDNHQGLISAEGGVVLESTDFRVESDDITVDLNEKIATATGDIIKIISGNQILFGDKLVYNYASKKGCVYQADTKVEDLNLAGDEIRFMLQETGDVMVVIDKAYLTTCIFDTPHYHVTASSIELYPDNRIILKNLKFYLGKVPVYYFPYYVIEYNPQTGEYKNVTPFPNLGYNSKYGLLVQLYYPYEIGKKNNGLVSIETNSDDERRSKWQHNYNINKNYKWVSRFIHNKIKEDNDDDEYDRTAYVDSGINYRQGGLNLYTGLRYDFLDDETLLDGRFSYTKGRYRFYTDLGYNLTIKDWEERYGITYNGNRAVYNLEYRSGYDLEYLPYLSIKGKTSNIAGFNTNLSLGMGRVRDEGITADKALFGLALARRLHITDNFTIGFNSDLAYHQYYGPFDEDYQVYNTSFTGGYYFGLTPTITLEPSLKYNITRAYGNPVIPDDKEDEERELKPGVELTYHLSRNNGSWAVGLEGSYDLEVEVWDEKIIRLTREYDCMSAFLEYDTVDSGFGFGIEIK